MGRDDPASISMAAAYTDGASRDITLKLRVSYMVVPLL